MCVCVLMLVQADDAPNRHRWVDFIQQLNGHHDNGHQDPNIPGDSTSPPYKPFRHVGPPSPPHKHSLGPPSPSTLRRMSSPNPPSSQHLPKSTGTSLLGRIKRTLTRQRDSEEPDYSSFTTFNQPLQDCPVSPENKVCSYMYIYTYIPMKSMSLSVFHYFLTLYSTVFTLVISLLPLPCLYCSVFL